MSSRALTIRSLETIKPNSNRQEIADRHLPGLYLIVQPSGARSWAVRYRSGGRTRKHTIGSYPAVDLKTARALAREALRAVAEGRDPGHEKAQARTPQPDTVEAVARQFVEQHCLRKNRPNTSAQAQRYLNLYVLPRWRNRLLRDITRRDVREALNQVIDAGKPLAANHLLTVVRKMCNWAVEQDIIDTSPCAGVKKPSVQQSRDRVLDDAELTNVWRAADQLGGPYGALIKLLILTGQRRNEVGGVRWSEIDFERGLWTLPAHRVKNNREHVVPLSAEALKILRKLPRVNDEFVFSRTGRTPMGGHTQNKHRLDALLPADMPPWCLHDLRRTLATGLQQLGVRLEVTEAVLNHTSGSRAGVVGIYQRHTWSTEKRTALDAWARHVLSLSPNRPALKAI